MIWRLVRLMVSKERKAGRVERGLVGELARQRFYRDLRQAGQEVWLREDYTVLNFTGRSNECEDDVETYSPVLLL